MLRHRFTLSVALAAGVLSVEIIIWLKATSTLLVDMALLSRQLLQWRFQAATNRQMGKLFLWPITLC